MSTRDNGLKTGASAARPLRLRDALNKARIEAAERTGVVVDLRDAEVARLEILNEALDPVFADIPDRVDIFERGITQGDLPRLWIDVVAHITMGRDKRTYRFVQDTRYGRIVLSESTGVPATVEAVTDYIARRIVEREHALAVPLAVTSATPEMRSRLWPFLLGFVLGGAALFALALIAAFRSL